MIVALQTKVSCPSCGHKIRYVAVAGVRVNKRSLRVTGKQVVLAVLEDRECPGCGQEVPAGVPLDREPYTLVPADAERVAAYRREKWDIEGGGAGAERVTG